MNGPLCYSILKTAILLLKWGLVETETITTVHTYSEKTRLDLHSCLMLSHTDLKSRISIGKDVEKMRPVLMLLTLKIWVFLKKTQARGWL